MADFQILPWDSDFFGMPTYSWYPESVTEDSLRSQRELLKSEGAHLCDIMVDAADTQSLSAIQAMGLLEMDAKTVYINTNPEAHAKADKRVLRQVGQVTEALTELGVAAGAYSRFALDPKLPKDSFKKLYAIWIQNSIDRKLAFEVLITGTQHTPTGLITLGKKGDRGDIGLVSVQASARGQGVGSSLVRNSLSVFLRHGINEVQVVTQGANKEACGLYEKCGFVKERITHIFHLHL